ncbi:MAG: glutamate ligase domain-containing protein, partial [Nocardioidaceae bacterium]
HLDNYGTEEAYHAAFSEFLDRIDPAGFLVVCIDDAGAADLAGQARERGLTTVGVGEADVAEVRADGVTFAGSTSTFTVVDRGRRLGEVRLQIPGRHYVLDALAALAAGLRLGFGFDELRRGLESFTGTRRRMELKGEVGGIRVYDSYAHHPNEIVGDLQAARSLAGEGRVVVAFQPHLVSRTRIFGTQMGEALGAADEVVVMDVYVAREDPEPGVDGQLVASHVPLPEDRVLFEPSWAETSRRLVERARPGDVVLTLGAGDVTLVGPEVLELLADGSAGAPD